MRYLHSDIETLERSEIITSLRRGEFDVLIGINLLREGLDLPEVSLVAILDADKEGFLRSETALIQTAGRAARNLNGKVVLYADVETNSIRRTVAETKRRQDPPGDLQPGERDRAADDSEGHSQSARGDEQSRLLGESEPSPAGGGRRTRRFPSRSASRGWRRR